ncbi:response regulator transcription factor [Luteimicrobium xylanilyticum]|uniref:Chemotaxis response regulator protein-glutamate methylesterase n=1 Tax=Luteimicrobium xylanilyticum TaxID=1133546 RepID=A0A5P9Q919_9MICO|nr:response regulator transcription factor [Luteimicrobium xylanilyticum]QFU97552.1 Chemotaxis response regulator protein-glutamate methylesterase [Luteimicrobium xylanilyticum]
MTTSSGTVRVLLVDDHPVVRDGLRGVLDAEPGIDVVGEAGDGEEALARLAALARDAPDDDPGVDLVLMDLRMPRMGGVETIGHVRGRFPAVRVLVLTTYDADRDVLPAIEAGATGYLLKDSPRDVLVDGVRAAAAGLPVLAPSVAGTLMGLVGAPAAEEPVLSPRELEVLRLVAAGATNRSAARQLFISEATVKTHLLHLYEKLGVRDRAAAVAAAYERRLLG